MMYIAMVTDKETRKLEKIESEYNSKKEFEKDLRNNGYSVRFITTEENFDEDCTKYHERLEKARIRSKAIRETERFIKSIEK